MRNILTDEEIKTLTKVKPKSLNLNISKKDYLRSLCTHFDSNGQKVLLQKEYSNLYCPICDAEFNLRVDVERKDIEDDINKVIDYIQTIKLISNFPREVAEVIYPIIPLLKKIPELYELAENEFNKPSQCNNNPYTMLMNNPYLNLYNVHNTEPFDPRGLIFDNEDDK